MAELLSMDSPATLFGDLVHQAAQRQEERPSAESTLYLVRLLADFVLPQALHERTETESDATVAEIFAAALASQGMRRFALFKLAGDLSLFISGVLPDSLTRRAVGFDYYQQLGGVAYTTAASDSRSSEVSELFVELATEFVLMVDVLNAVSERCALSERPDLLGFHQRWVQLRSRRAARYLRGAGVTFEGVSSTTH